MIVSWVVFLFNAFHVCIFFMCSSARFLFHQGTVHECRLGSVCGIGWCALFTIILLISAVSLFMLVEGGYRLLLLCVWVAKLSQFASFSLKIGVFLLMVVSVGKRVIMIGKWSLPKRSSIRFQVVIGVREGEQKLRSMCVKVLCLVKLVTYHLVG